MKLDYDDKIPTEHGVSPTERTQTHVIMAKLGQPYAFICCEDILATEIRHTSPQAGHSVSLKSPG